jgi:RNA polymerase sigma-70 factor (ECF subfamily)
MHTVGSASSTVGEQDIQHMEDVRHSEFEALLQSHQGIVFKVANTYCWHPDDRADLVQDIVAELWRAWPRFDPARTFSTWMYRIALNVAISFVRKEVRHRHISVPLDETLHDTAATSGEPTDSSQRLQVFIERQAPLDRALLLLYLEDKSQREIAEILGITATNVSTKINRLKQRIRQEL